MERVIRISLLTKLMYEDLQIFTANFFSFLQKLVFYGIKPGLQKIVIRLLHSMPSENVKKVKAHI